MNDAMSIANQASEVVAETPSSEFDVLACEIRAQLDQQSEKLERLANRLRRVQAADVKFAEAPSAPSESEVGGELASMLARIQQHNEYITELCNALRI